MPRIAADFIDTGKVRYAVRDFPLVQIHRHAFKAAEAARCAREQGKFWKMHDRLFAHQRALAPEQLLEHGQAVGLDVEWLERCLNEDRHAEGVSRDLSEGAAAGVRGTPHFIVGLARPDSKVIRVATSFSGAQPYDVFEQIIGKLLEYLAAQRGE